MNFGSKTLRIFLSHFRIVPADKAPDTLLEEVISRFSRIPYENLTKIIKFAAVRDRGRARRSPPEVMKDHIACRTGGTCFSLTETILHLVRALGWEAQPVLADRRYGSNTHCAFVMRLQGNPFLLDPGFLITKPVPLIKNGEIFIDNGFNRLLLRARENGCLLDLYTLEGARPVYRLTYKTRPVDRGEFIAAWDASFGWEMMRYPLVTMVSDRSQRYLRGMRLQRRDCGSVAKEELDPAGLVERISSEFGIAPRIGAQALRILKEQGELRG